MCLWRRALGSTTVSLFVGTWTGACCGLLVRTGLYRFTVHWIANVLKSHKQIFIEPSCPILIITLTTVVCFHFNITFTSTNATLLKKIHTFNTVVIYFNNLLNVVFYAFFCSHSSWKSDTILLLDNLLTHAVRTLYKLIMRITLNQSCWCIFCLVVITYVLTVFTFKI